jgi:RDD family
MGRRVALLIATYQYHDAGLRQLTAPARDAESFAAVLQDPDIAGFEVTTLINEPHHRVGEAIGDFYRDRRVTTSRCSTSPATASRTMTAGCISRSHFPDAEPPLPPAIELQPPPSAATGPGLSTEKSGSEPTVQQQWMSSPPGSGPGFGAPGIGQVPGPLAGFGARVFSFLIDVVAPLIAFFLIAAVIEVFIAVFGLIAFAVWNSGYRQGTTGQSIGRRVTKTKLVKIETGEPIGFGMALLRRSVSR